MAKSAKASGALVIYDEPRSHTLTLSRDQMFEFIPGLNRVPLDFWEAIRVDDQVKAMLDGGALTHIDYTDEVTAEFLVSLPERKAAVCATNIQDMILLESFRAAESTAKKPRRVVLQEIEIQLDRLRKVAA